MSIQLRLHAFDLRLKHTFTISRESVDIQPTFIVELIDGDHHGYGEATANAYYGFTIESMSEAVNAIKDRIENASWSRPEELHATLQPLLKDHPFALCAIDQAAYDLWGKRLGRPVYELLGLSLDNIPDSDYTIGIDEIDVMVAKMKEFPDWPIYKVKLGTDRDLEIIRALREHTDAVFRVDANCGWSVCRQCTVHVHDFVWRQTSVVESRIVNGSDELLESVRSPPNCEVTRADSDRTTMILTPNFISIHKNPHRLTVPCCCQVIPLIIGEIG